MPDFRTKPTAVGGGAPSALPGGRHFRRDVAVVLSCLAVGLALFIGTRNVGWKRKYDAAMEAALWSYDAGNFPTAQNSLRQALVYNPYSGDAHFLLADILHTHLGDNEDALRHYLSGLRHAPGHPRAKGAANAIAALEMIMTGVIEDPFDAAEDMALATAENAFAAFAERLGPDLAPHADAFWRGWRARGLGNLAYRRVAKNVDGDYDAVLGFLYEDGSSRSMHFFCRAGEPWKLTVAFP